MFEHAFYTLTALFSGRGAPAQPPRSMLNLIVQITEEVVEYRYEREGGGKGEGGGEPACMPTCLEMIELTSTTASNPTVMLIPVVRGSKSAGQ